MRVMNYLSICCIVKDEDPFLAEWLAYHALIGVEHFYIYDNESAVPVRKHPAVKKYLAAGRASVMEITGRQMQLRVYDHCIQKFGRDNFWIAFIDLDEFICLKTPGRELSDARPLLAEFEEHAGLGLSWQPFTSGGRLGSPESPVISSYTQVPARWSRDNFHIKSIMRPNRAGAAKNAHTFLTLNGASMVNEEHRPIPQGWPFSQPSYERAWLNHYHYKSQQDYEFKIARGRADLVKDDNAELKYKAFYAHVDAASRESIEIAKLAPLLLPWIERENVPPPLPEPAAESGLGGYLALCQSILDGALDTELGIGPNKTAGNGNERNNACKGGGAALSRERRQNLAQAVLCRAACRFENELQLWVVRATLARLSKNFGAAWRFINKALGMEEHPLAYEELFHLTMATKGKAQAANVLEYMKDLPRCRMRDSGFAKKLELYEKMVR